MLVLTRKKSQLIQIGDNIVIKVIRTGPGTVKLGIDAPSDVRVMRGELDAKLTESYEEFATTDKAEKSSNGSSAAPSPALTAGETAVAECRRPETADEEEPASHGSRRRAHGYVA